MKILKTLDTRGLNTADIVIGNQWIVLHSLGQTPQLSCQTRKYFVTILTTQM